MDLNIKELIRAINEVSTDTIIFDEEKEVIIVNIKKVK